MKVYPPYLHCYGPIFISVFLATKAKKRPSYTCEHGEGTMVRDGPGSFKVLVLFETFKHRWPKGGGTKQQATRERLRQKAEKSFAHGIAII